MLAVIAIQYITKHRPIKHRYEQYAIYVYKQASKQTSLTIDNIYVDLQKKFVILCRTQTWGY